VQGVGQQRVQGTLSSLRVN